MPRRVLLAGLFHETHTFLDEITAVDDFAWLHGQALLQAEGDGSPLGGALEVAREFGWDVVPAVDARATPSGTAADEVLTQFWRNLEAVAKASSTPFDGVYLVLHGAMVTESCRDVEGELVRRLRELPSVGQIPICGVLDLHGNISAQVEYTQGLIAYRENPHTDAAEAACRGARLLEGILAGDVRPRTVFQATPIIWPPTGTGTADDPMRHLEAMARNIEVSAEEILAVNVFGGFSYADTCATGVSFSAVTLGSETVARDALRTLSEWAIDHREMGNVVPPELEDVLPDILASAGPETAGPTLIVEPADNIGGGAPGDCTGALRVLKASGAPNAVAVVNDPSAVLRCQNAGVGGAARLGVGGRASRFSGGEVALDGEVLALSDGRFELEDLQSHLASLAGRRIDMGPCAVVRDGSPRDGGLRVLLTTNRTPPFDLGQLRSQGIKPEAARIIVVKAAVAHRRAYDPIAGASFTVETTGPCASRLDRFPYAHVRRPVYPLDVG